MDMYARVTRTEGLSQDRWEEGVRQIKETIIPAAQKMPGFKGGHWLGDRRSGKGAAIALWESEEALRSSEQAVEKLRTEASQNIGFRPVSVERYEVAAQHGEGPSEGNAKLGRLTTAKGSPDKIEEGIRAFKEKAVPTLQKVEGFVGVYLLVDRKSGKAIVLGRWRSEKDLEKAERDGISQLRAQVSERFGARDPDVETFEITAEAGAGARVGV
jgi:heme-degrading monooxygenase HmoA